MQRDGRSAKGASSVRQKQPELVIGLIAPLGTSLSRLIATLSDELAAVGYKATPIVLSEIMSGVRGKLGVKLLQSPEDKRISSHMRGGNALREKARTATIMAQLAIARIRQERKKSTGDENDPDTGRAYILRSLKNSEEVRELRRVYGAGFVAIAAYSPKSVRIQNLTESI